MFKSSGSEVSLLLKYDSKVPVVGQVVWLFTGFYLYLSSERSIT